MGPAHRTGRTSGARLTGPVGPPARPGDPAQLIRGGQLVRELRRAVADFLAGLVPAPLAFVAFGVFFAAVLFASPVFAAPVLVAVAFAGAVFAAVLFVPVLFVAAVFAAVVLAAVVFVALAFADVVFAGASVLAAVRFAVVADLRAAGTRANFLSPAT